MAAKNQCGGCQAGYPRLVSHRFGRTSYYHVMGPRYKLLGKFHWQDTMSCQKEKYEDDK